MNVVILGASRGVGRCLVKQALAANHHVTAAVRDPGSVPLEDPRLSVVRCDVRDKHAVAAAVTGQDVVFCTLGADSRGPTTLYSDGASSILQAMREKSVRRLIFLSNFGVLAEKADDWLQSLQLFVTKRLLPHVLADHQRALDRIWASSFDWTVVRPLPLTNGVRTGRYRVSLDGLPARGRQIARADVADFMLGQATSVDYLQRVPAIAY